MAFEQADPTNTGSNGDPMPEGFHTKCRLVKAKMGRGQVSNNPYCSFKFEVLESDNPAAVGKMGDMFEQLEGAKFPSYNVQAQGRVLQLVGALSGLTAADAKGKVGAREVQLVTDEATQPFNGRVVSIRAKKVAVTKNGDPIIRCESFPCESAPMSAPAVVPAAPAALPKFPHPDAPGMFYDASGAIFDAAGKKVN